jgi:hypothetical protein
MFLSYSLELVYADERTIFGPDIVAEAEEEVKQIRANILTAQTVKRAMQTNGAVPWSLRLAIMYTYRFCQ